MVFSRVIRETHLEDLRLPLHQRPAMSVLVAMREWDFGALRTLQRTSIQAARER